MKLAFVLLLLSTLLFCVHNQESFVRSEPIIVEGDDYEGPLYMVQVYAAREKERTKKKYQELKILINERAEILFEEPYWKIRVGSYKNKQQAEKVRAELKHLGYKDAWIITINSAKKN